jgi:hypothetical protein
MSGRSNGGRGIARARTLDVALDHEGRAEDADRFGGILSRAIRSHQLWLTVGYFAALLLLARAYA